MPGPNWSDDNPADRSRIESQVAVAATDAALLGVQRGALCADDLKRWHSTVYEGCVVPVSDYVGRFRGEPPTDLVDYEVGVGRVLADGLPEGVGVWAADVSREVDSFFERLAAACEVLDGSVAPGRSPTEVAVLNEVVEVIAVAHGEWIRIHPFVNGNGRTARLICAHLSVRYGLPIFVTLKPRPHDVAYARAATKSMGRPPHFSGRHAETIAVFVHLLALHILDPA